DFNGDGIIDNSDLILLYSFINGINPGPAPAQGRGSIAFSGAQFAADSSAVLPVGIRNASGVRTLGITLNYDPSLISYQAFSSSFTSGKNTVHAFEIKPGTAKFIVQSADDMTGNINPGSIILHLSGSKMPAGTAVQTTYSINGGPDNIGPDLLLKNDGITSAGGEKSKLPSEFSLSQNYPNPFNPSTVISYSVPEVSFVTLRIYNLMGQEVRNLISEEKSPGKYFVKWNGENNSGKRVSSGIYLYRLTAGNHTETRKMNLLK
ncbi:MAG: T9SS type A sorting domain-containing protein, partial [Syntrophothermus sp.]